MLIEFSVENHRVFREKQTFSMVASAAVGRAGEGYATGFSAVSHVHREACLFGANASGKSSLIDAMNFMSNFVKASFRRQAGKTIPVEPFAFHAEWLGKPSEFEVVFIQDETLYEYGFALTHERVVEEWLFSRPKNSGRQRRIFTRFYDENKGTYEWEISPLHLKGERDSWRSQTRPDALFLSTAVQLDAEGLKAPYNWFSEKLEIIDFKDFRLSVRYTLSRFKEDGWKERILRFLCEIDIPVQDIIVEEEENLSWDDLDDLPSNLQSGFREMKSTIEKIRKGMQEEFSTNNKILSAELMRRNNEKIPVHLNIQKESSGTIGLLALSGHIMEVLDSGKVLVVDDLNSGLHPLAFRHLITMFGDMETNRNNAQLIFTTHETSITEEDSDCMGRDQIWLIEKDNKSFDARLFPFSDYKTRKSVSFGKGYLQGRYGAIPHIAR